MIIVNQIRIVLGSLQNSQCRYVIVESTKSIPLVESVKNSAKFECMREKHRNGSSSAFVVVVQCVQRIIDQLVQQLFRQMTDLKIGSVSRFPKSSGLSPLCPTNKPNSKDM